jgi:hypothetical protein
LICDCRAGPTGGRGRTTTRGQSGEQRENRDGAPRVE